MHEECVVLEEEFLTTEEVAELARTGPSTVRFWRMQGKLDFGVKRGRRVLYPKARTLRWLAGEDEKATA